MYHRTDLATIEGAILHGLGQKALDLIPLVDPWAENDYPPTWWYNYNTASTWRAHLNNRRIPDTWLIDQYLRYCWRMVGFYAEEVGPWARDEAKRLVREWTGVVLYNWRTFSDWIDNIGNRLGKSMVTWATDAFDALKKTYNWLPIEIRTNLQSWATLVENWKQKVKDWVVATYHAWIALGLLAWDWVRDTGNKLKPWWEAARGLLDEFRANPTAFIVSRLGWWWNKLKWYAEYCLDFYANLWSQHGGDLAEFLANPVSWFWDKLEVYIDQHW